MHNLQHIWHSVKMKRPSDRHSLRLWVGVVLGLWMPERGTCPTHGTPLDYLCHAFFEQPGDAVVWACRGGGKTMIGAVATLLDLLFKPGIQVRILGGSFEQSEKMYAYLKDMIRQKFPELLKREPTQRRLELTNGSRVEVLAQSDRSVRGMRVQKLRCDEVELFDPQVWQAAQLTTRSRPHARGAVEVFSTQHRPNGLMQEILEAAPAAGKKIFSWCLLDVIEKCPPARSCQGCPLWQECRGHAKDAAGFITIEDAIAMKARVSKETWDHEMLCQRPKWEDAVFPHFSRTQHVRPFAGIPERVICGVDFGFAGAFVCIWVAILHAGDKRVAWVIDEMVARQQTVSANAAAMKQRPWQPAAVYCDVAGKQRNAQTGIGDESVLRKAGFLVRSSWQRIETGIELIRQLVEPAAAEPRLFVHPQCPRLIAAFEGYRRAEDGHPLKDGVHDHLIDALRYAITGEFGGGSKVQMRMY